MGLLSEYKQIMNEHDRILEETVIELFEELRTPAERGGGTPVDTGFLRSSWEAPKKTNDGYVITNTANYASIVLSGIFFFDGKTVGSKQLPEGIDPILVKYNEILQRRLNEIN